MQTMEKVAMSKSAICGNERELLPIAELSHDPEDCRRRSYNNKHCRSQTLKTEVEVAKYLFAVPGRGRYGKFWPVVDMVPISGSFKKTIHPVLQPVKKLVLEYGKMVGAVQDRSRSSCPLHISFNVGDLLLAVESHEGTTGSIIARSTGGLGVLSMIPH